MKIMKLADGCNPGSQHLSKRPFAQTPERIRVQSFDQLVHGLAPAPEGAAVVGKRFAQAAKPALKCVAVRVDHTRQERLVAELASRFSIKRAHVLDVAVGADDDLDPLLEPHAGPGPVGLDDLSILHGSLQRKERALVK